MAQEYYYRNRKKILFLDFLRNVLIGWMPERFGPLARRLIPYEPDFIFFTHPRNDDDVYATFPFLKILRRFMPSAVALRILNFSRCYIVSLVQGPSQKRGYFISVTHLPRRLFASRELTMKLIQSSVSFFRKITHRKVFIGLAAWWPIVSNSGLLFQKYLEKNDNLVVTSGHTATLASIYLSVLKLSQILEVSLRELKLLIIGVGKVGGALADLLIKDVSKVGLVDRNYTKVEIAKQSLQRKSLSVEIETVIIHDSNFEDVITSKIQEYDVVVCTTSNTGLLISDESKLKNCIILDDSRPEAFPRIFSVSQKAVVLEGGLMKIPNVKMDSDFGFGKDDNVFGCLSEAIMLAIDSECTFKPNIGEVDYKNLFDLIEFCKSSNIEIGDFKCGEQVVTPEQIKAVFLSARS